MNNYWKNYPDIESELVSVKEYMLDSISDAIPIIKNPIENIIMAGGKMLRPAMVILGAKFGKYDAARIIPIAASIEFLHTATLIHDDIIDESKLRRGIESVQSKYSKDVAVLVGDYIFAKTFEILAGDYPAEMLKNLSKSIMSICKGELAQYSYRYEGYSDIDQYIEIISGKTASLFSMSLFSGAYEGAVKNQTQQHLVKIGFAIGIMFQIIDDCLDYSSDSKLLGKNTINDIKQGYITLPLFFAMQNDDSGELKKIVFSSDLDENQISCVKSLVEKNNGVKLAKEKASEYFELANKSLKKLRKSKQKEVLEYIVDSMIKRTY